MNASPRTSGLFADRSSAAASVPGRNPLGCVATGSARRVGFVASDGTDGDLAAPRPAAITRPTELELARIRHAGRVLAAEENARAPGRLADGQAACESGGGLTAGDRGLHRQRMGTQCPQLRPDAHSYDQVPMHKLDDQRATINKSMDIIEKFWGRRPRGWFGPGLTQTFDTLDYLAQAGIEYI